MSKASIILAALDLELRDDPAKRYHSAVSVLSPVAVVAGLLAIMAALAAALASQDYADLPGLLMHYAWSAGFAAVSALAYSAAGWCDAHQPPADFPLSDRDAETVSEHLRRHGATTHYRRVLALKGPATYRTVRDFVSDACVDAYQGRLAR